MHSLRGTPFRVPWIIPIPHQDSGVTLPNRRPELKRPCCKKYS